MALCSASFNTSTLSRGKCSSPNDDGVKCLLIYSSGHMLYRHDSVDDCGYSSCWFLTMEDSDTGKQVCISPPTWDKLYFLRVVHPNGTESEVRYGLLGYTGSKSVIGYHFP